MYFKDRSAKYQIPMGPIFLVIFHFCLTNQPSGASFSQNYQVNHPIHDFGNFDILVCKIPTKQVADKKFCKSSPFIDTY